MANFTRIRTTIMGTLPPENTNVFWIDTSNQDSPELKAFVDGEWRATSGGNEGGSSEFIETTGGFSAYGQGVYAGTFILKNDEHPDTVNATKEDVATAFGISLEDLDAVFTTKSGLPLRLHMANEYTEQDEMSPEVYYITEAYDGVFPPLSHGRNSTVVNGETLSEEASASWAYTQESSGKVIPITLYHSMGRMIVDNVTFEYEVYKIYGTTPRQA